MFRPAFDRAASAMRMDGEARHMVNAFKYHAHFWLRDDLVDLMEASVRARLPVGEIDLVLAMPSTARHLWLRGYNPARELTKPLARRLGVPAPAFVVRRVGSPRRQAGLSEEERRANAVGTFAVTRPKAVAGRTVLVVDDVMTTGSTLSECAAELKRAGAARVWCASAVRSLHT